MGIWCDIFLLLCEGATVQDLNDIVQRIRLQLRKLLGIQVAGNAEIVSTLMYKI